MGKTHIKWTKARRKAHGEKIRKAVACKKEQDSNPTSLKNLVSHTFNSNMADIGKQIYNTPITYQVTSDTMNDERFEAIESRLLLLEKLNGFGRLLRKCGII